MCLVAHSCRPGQQRRSASWALRGGSCGVARGAREEDERDCRGGGGWRPCLLYSALGVKVTEEGGA